MLDLCVLSRSFVREQGEISGRILTLVIFEDKQIHGNSYFSNNHVTASCPPLASWIWPGKPELPTLPIS